MAEYIWILKNKDAALFSNPQWRARRRCVWFSASSWELDPQAGLSRNDLDFEGNVQSSNRHSSTILNNYTAALKLKKLSWMNWGTWERIPNAGHFHIIQHDIKKTPFKPFSYDKIIQLWQRSKKTFSVLTSRPLLRVSSSLCSVNVVRALWVQHWKQIWWQVTGRVKMEKIGCGCGCEKSKQDKVSPLDYRWRRCLRPSLVKHLCFQLSPERHTVYKHAQPTKLDDFFLIFPNRGWPSAPCLIFGNYLAFFWKVRKIPPKIHLG